MNRDLFKRAREKKSAIGHAARPTWALVMNHEEAHMFQVGGNKPAVWLRSFANVKGRLRNKDLEADRPGRVYDRFGGGRHAMAASTSAQDQLLHDFSKTLVARLQQAFSRNEFEAFYLIGPSKMLGWINKEMSAPLQKQRLAQYRKVLRREEIENYLNEKLFPSVDRTKSPILKKLKGRRYAPAES